LPAAPTNVAQKRERATGRADKVAHEWIDEMLNKGSQVFVVFIQVFYSLHKIIREENVHLISSQPPRGQRTQTDHDQREDQQCYQVSPDRADIGFFS